MCVRICVLYSSYQLHLAGTRKIRNYYHLSGEISLIRKSENQEFYHFGAVLACLKQKILQLISCFMNIALYRPGMHTFLDTEYPTVHGFLLCQLSFISTVPDKNWLPWLVRLVEASNELYRIAYPGNPRTLLTYTAQR